MEAVKFNDLKSRLVGWLLRNLSLIPSFDLKGNFPPLCNDLNPTQVVRVNDLKVGCVLASLPTPLH